MLYQNNNSNIRTRALQAIRPVHLTMLLSGFVLLLSLSMAQAANRQSTEIVSSVDKNLISDGLNAESYVDMANQLLDQQQFHKALNLYSKAILSDREIDNAFLGRSLAYGGIGKAHESIADLNVFILRNPRHSMAHVYRGIRYMAQGNTEYAEENLLKAIRLNPKNAQAYDDLGVLYAQQGEIQKALKYFGQTLRLDPYNEMAYHNLAIAYYLLDDNDKALKSVNRAIRLMPESRDTYILKAQILDSMGKSAQAKEVRTYAQYLQEEGWTESASIN